MKLNEKIYYCRKKSGKSQETLAAELGVSRQSVSKWELGDSEPEISKLKLLAKSFGVSIDWLLSEDEPEEEQKAPESEKENAAQTSNWVDSIPGTVGKLIRRYGWIFGLRIFLSGLGVTAMGILARFMVKRMFSGVSVFPGEDIIISSGMEFTGFGNMLSHNPVYIMSGFMIGLGIVLAIAGAILAIILKKSDDRK